MIDNPGQYVILVSGATGQQGGSVARHLLAKHFRVRALTRNKDQDAARRLADAGAEIVEGSFDDQASLEQVFEGVYGAYSVQNTWKVGVEGEIRQGKAFADAAQKASVKHFVYSSVGGAERNTGIPHFDSKREIEKYIQSLQLPATILRPVFFMNNWMRMKESILNGQLAQPLSPDTSLQQVAVDDVGAFARISFTNPDKWIGRSIEIAGDELTMRQTAAVFSEVTGRNVQYIQISWDTFKEKMGEESTTMFRWFEEKGYEADIEKLRREYPALKSLKAFLQTTGL